MSAGAQIKFITPSKMVKCPPELGGVGSVHRRGLYRVTQLRSRIHKPAGDGERRAGPRLRPGGLRAQHPTAGSACSQLQLRPASTALNLSWMCHLETPVKPPQTPLSEALCTVPGHQRAAPTSVRALPFLFPSWDVPCRRRYLTGLE